MRSISALGRLAVYLAEVVAWEEGKVCVALEAVEESVEAGRRPVVEVVWLSHAVGAAVREGLFFDFEVLHGVELDISRWCHPQMVSLGLCVLRAVWGGDG